jgi:hypothetical protein
MQKKHFCQTVNRIYYNISDFDQEYIAWSKTGVPQLFGESVAFGNFFFNLATFLLHFFDGSQIIKKLFDEIKKRLYVLSSGTSIETFILSSNF